MKIYEIVLFVFILNLCLNIVNMLDFTTDYSSPLPETALMNKEEAAGAISDVVGENQNWLTGSLNWLVESVKLAIQGIGAFITLILNSTLLSYNIYYKFLCYGGVSCLPGTIMWTFATALSTLTYLVYTIALVQFATGKSLPTME